MVIPLSANLQNLNAELEASSIPGAVARLQSYKLPLRAISVGYIAASIFALISSELANIPSWLLMVAMARSIIAAREGNACPTNCVMPFSMYACLTLFLDTFLLLAKLSLQYPTPADFFSWSCPADIPWVVPTNRTVYTPGDAQQILVRAGTTVERSMDWCSTRWWVSANIMLVLVLCLDLVAAFLGWRMLSLLNDLAGPEDAAETGGGGGGSRHSLANAPIVDAEEGRGRQRDLATARRQGPAGQQGNSRPGQQGRGRFQAFQGDVARLSL